jgi:ribosomal protein S6-L-glutamate ligase RimK-like protein
VYRIAIQPDNQYLMSGRYQSFSTRWTELARASGHDVRLVNVFEPDLAAQLKGCDGFMWWFAHLPHPREIGRRVLPAVQHGLRIPVFPTWNTIWHFDDKVSQKYLLDAADIPMPETWVFWSRREALAFCRDAQYPLVIKLASGIVSENVRLLDSFDDARYWIDRLFGAGVVSLERRNPLSPREVLRRLRGSAKYLLKGLPPDPGLRTNVQKGYLLVQEFLPGNDFDTRVTVIGNRAFGFRRFNRDNDFRASGSGRIDFDPAKIDPEVVRLAFKTARALGTQSLAVDSLQRRGERVLAEISYYYEGWALEECPGHWEFQGDDPAERLEWVEGRLGPADAIFNDFVATIARQASSTATQPLHGRRTPVGTPT